MRFGRPLVITLFVAGTAAAGPPLDLPVPLDSKRTIFEHDLSGLKDETGAPALAEDRCRAHASERAYGLRLSS